MARLARAVAAGLPHLVTQRGDRGQKTFFGEGDYAAYKSLLAEGCARAKVQVLAYALLPNKVHLIVVPQKTESLRAALGETHRRYTRFINARKGWRGLLWQGRFASCPVEEDSLVAAAKYVELAPVRGRLARRAGDWKWSSAAAHLRVRKDDVVDVRPLLTRARDWKKALAEGLSKDELQTISMAESTGRPLGSPSFIRRLEKKLGRVLARQKPGPKPGSRRRKSRKARRHTQRR